MNGLTIVKGRSSVDTHTWCILHLRDRDQARDSDTIERWFTQSLTSGYAIHADSSACIYDPAYIASTGIPAEVRRSLRQYLAGVSESFSFSLTREPLATTFECTFAPNEGMLLLDVSDQNFNDRYTCGNGAACYSLWLTFVEQCYTLWRPIYGFATGDGGHEGFIERDDALALDISFLYTHGNLFGPELVEKLGRDRLETAPADYRRAFDDGGIHLVPATYHDLGRMTDDIPGDAPATEKLHDALLTARHLGMDAMDWLEYTRRWNTRTPQA